MKFITLFNQRQLYRAQCSGTSIGFYDVTGTWRDFYADIRNFYSFYFTSVTSQAAASYSLFPYASSDKVIDGYYYDGAFYKDLEHTTSIAGEAGTLYVDKQTYSCYRWDNNAFTATNVYQAPNQVGTPTITVAAPTNTGGTMNIKIVGTASATINSLFFTRKLFHASNTSKEALLFAVALDSPVELNAENNYTANFVFAVEQG